jgi:phage terminase small subunit
MKLNAKQQQFAELVASGFGQADAYIRAGYAVKGADASASKLLRNPKVSVLVAELRAKTAAASDVTREWLVVQQQRLAVKAEAMGDLAVSRACLGEVTKLTGHYMPTKTENHTTVEGAVDINTNQMNDQLFAALIGADAKPTATH